VVGPPAEVIEYARWLGVEEGEDDELLWVAREGLTAQLPPNWKPWYVRLLSDRAALCVSQCCITPTPRRNVPRYTAELALPGHPIRLRCARSPASQLRFLLRAGPRLRAAAATTMARSTTSTSRRARVSGIIPATLSSTRSA
jgi:hypothetical protein